MTRRSFAGYACEESLSTGLFGECFRAKNKNGVEARVLVVDSELSQHQEFAAGLARFGTQLKELVHPHIVTTQTIGRGKDGSLVVIASAVENATALGTVLTQFELPQDVALSICMGVLRGLSHAHQEGVIHGGVHPQSVLIDGNGVSQIADFGLGRALSCTAATAKSAKLLDGLKGYLAPEMISGNAEIASDVFSMGVLASQLLWRTPTPPPGDTSTFAKVLTKATQKDLDKRYSNVGELESEFRAVIKKDDLRVAIGSEVQAFLASLTSKQSEADVDLEADTADLLSSLGMGGQDVDGEVTAISEPQGMGLSDALGGLFDDEATNVQEPSEAEPDDETVVVPAEALPAMARKSAVESSSGSAFEAASKTPGVDSKAISGVPFKAIPEAIPADESLANTAPFQEAAMPIPKPSGGVGDSTTVDRAAAPEKHEYRAPAQASAQQASAPRSSQASAPRSSQASAQQASAPRSSQASLASSQVPFQAPSEGQFDDVIRNPAPLSIVATKSRPHAKVPVSDDYGSDDATPLPAPRPFHMDGTHVGELVDRVERQAASNSPFDDEDDLPEAQSGRFKSLRLVALIVFVMAVLVAVAVTKTDFFRAAKNESKKDFEDSVLANKNKQPKEGMISIVSETNEAAVWLLVGRTPAQSFPLSSAMVHELRVDYEGYQSVFLSVAAQHWSGAQSERKAELSLQLVRAATKVVLPAFPPEVDPPLTPAGVGQGPIRVTSQPEGAEVWLWVGTTPLAELNHIEAGKDYEFKILKDGYQPAFTVIKANDWYLSGHDGPIRKSLKRDVVLEASPSESAGKGKEKRSHKKSH